MQISSSNDPACLIQILQFIPFKLRKPLAVIVIFSFVSDFLLLFILDKVILNFKYVSVIYSFFPMTISVPEGPPQNCVTGNVTGKSFSISCDPPTIVTGKFSYRVELHGPSGKS